MRAVVHERYGPPEVLRLDDVDRPVPEEDEILVRVHATTVNRTDCHRRAAKPFFWRFMPASCGRSTGFSAASGGGGRGRGAAVTRVRGR